MVLSNAERQERYRQRLRQRAGEGVTAAEIVDVAKLIHERDAAGERTAESWDAWLRACRQNRKRGGWSTGLPTDSDAAAWVEFGFSQDEAERIARVAGVVRAVLYPPEG